MGVSDTESSGERLEEGGFLHAFPQASTKPCPGRENRVGHPYLIGEKITVLFVVVETKPQVPGPVGSLGNQMGVVSAVRPVERILAGAGTPLAE